MARKVILVFDIGKTNKKVILFDQHLQMVSEEEDKFEEITDDDGFAHLGAHPNRAQRLATTRLRFFRLDWR